MDLESQKKNFCIWIQGLVKNESSKEYIEEGINYFIQIVKAVENEKNDIVKDNVVNLIQKASNKDSDFESLEGDLILLTKEIKKKKYKLNRKDRQVELSLEQATNELERMTNKCIEIQNNIQKNTNNLLKQQNEISKNSIRLEKWVEANKKIVENLDYSEKYNNLTQRIEGIQKRIKQLQKNLKVIDNNIIDIVEDRNEFLPKFT